MRRSVPVRSRRQVECVVQQLIVTLSLNHALAGKVLRLKVAVAARPQRAHSDLVLVLAVSALAPREQRLCDDHASGCAAGAQADSPTESLGMESEALAMLGLQVVVTDQAVKLAVPDQTLSLLCLLSLPDQKYTTFFLPHACYSMK
jgi:hypothetical protein